MSDNTLYRLARHAGLLVDWTDAADRPQRVSDETVRLVLAALGFPCESESDAARSLAELDAVESTCSPQFVTADTDRSILLPGVIDTQARLMLEDGAQQDVALARGQNRSARLPPIGQPGYHTLHLKDRTITLAVAPKRCFSLSDVAGDAKLWGLAVQLYGLRRDGDDGCGDTRALAMLARDAAARGADAVAISPIHALFSARPDKFSPYAPSNRLFLNPLLADSDFLFGEFPLAQPKSAYAPDYANDALVDWPRAAARKIARLRALFDDFWTRLSNGEDALVHQFMTFRQMGGQALENHALFEAIHAEMVGRDPHNCGWQTWPEAYSAPDRPAVSRFAVTHQRDVTFHIFLQWIADAAFANAQHQARAAGMRLGLISDLAVGMEPGGSYTWADRRSVLDRMTIGAPPDLFNAQGQGWGLTTFSPRGLVERHFAPFIETLRASMRHAGGIRIDHVLGLKRLWVVPKDVPARAGAYLAYPFDDLLRLVRLESQRHRAVVIGEDLGTVPDGLRTTLSDSAIAGMDVLWFSRDESGFIDPRLWRRDGVAMTTTHDLPTIAGWWRGVDIAHGTGEDDVAANAAEKAARAADRADLERAFSDAQVAAEVPATSDESAATVDTAIGFVGKSPAPLVLLPLEDLLGLEDQPNVPGTTDTQPNWRRRYPISADEVFANQRAAARAAMLTGRTDA